MLRIKKEAIMDNTLYESLIKSTEETYQSEIGRWRRLYNERLGQAKTNMQLVGWAAGGLIFFLATNSGAPGAIAFLLAGGVALIGSYAFVEMSIHEHLLESFSKVARTEAKLVDVYIRAKTDLLDKLQQHRHDVAYLEQFKAEKRHIAPAYRLVWQDNKLITERRE